MYVCKKNKNDKTYCKYRSDDHSMKWFQSNTIKETESSSFPSLIERPNATEVNSNPLYLYEIY
jgi:hypothetical protein